MNEHLQQIQSACREIRSATTTYNVSTPVFERCNKNLDWIERSLAAADERDAQLREELTELMADAFYEIASETEPGTGWYCTNGRSTAVGYGDRLVELGVFERDATRGIGRVQWFRSVKKTG